MYSLKEYQEKRQSIINDERFSEKGKAEKLAKLDEIYRSNALDAIKDLRERAVTSSLIAKREQEKRLDEMEKALGNIDYSRLNYEMQAIRSTISGEPLVSIMERWEKDKQAGNGYRIKAWKEVIAGEVRENWKDRDEFNYLPELLADIDETPNEVVKVKVSDDEKDALAELEDVRQRASEINQVFAEGQAVLKRVFSGISQRDGLIELGFETEIHKLSDKPETDLETAWRLEREYQRHRKQYGELLHEQGLGRDIDLDFDDISDAIDALAEDEKERKI